MNSPEGGHVADRSSSRGVHLLELDVVPPHALLVAGILHIPEREFQLRRRGQVERVHLKDEPIAPVTHNLARLQVGNLEAADRGPGGGGH